MLGVAAREATRAKLAEQIDAAVGGAAVLVAIQVEHQGGQHDRMIGGKSACDGAAQSGHVANDGLLGKHGAARFQMSGKNRDCVLEQSHLFHQDEGVSGLGLAERLVSFLDEARHGGLGEIGAMTLDGDARGGLDFEAELGGESHRAHHADGILAHPQLGVADSADQSSPEIVNSAGKIDHMKILRAVEQRVDGEVAAKRVFLGRAESIVETNQRIVGIGDGLGLAAEGGDLDILAAEENVDQAKAPAYQARVAEQLADLLGMGRSGNVEILGLAREHQVAHAAADQVCLVSGAGEAIEDLEDVGVDIAARDGMLGALKYAGFQFRLPEFAPKLARRRAGFIAPARDAKGHAPPCPRSEKRATLNDNKGDCYMDKLLTDVKKIRENARKHIEEGAVTEGYKADRQEVLKVLNGALATEIVCVLRYKRHYYMAQGINSDSVKAEFLQHANEEQQHADWIAERITQLGGEPDFNPKGLADRSHAEYVEGKTLVDMIKEDLVAERIAIQTYQEIIRWLGDGDPTTKILIEQINKMEEEHANDMSDLLSKMS